jgi:hypothetical protein
MIRFNSSGTRCLAAAGLALLVLGCTTGKEETPPSEQTGTSEGVALGSDSVAGLSWTVHNRWKKGEDQPMRVATYVVPASEGDLEDAECAVYYFGPDQGGGVEANIQRWIGQFEQPDGGASENAAKVSTWNTNGVEITSMDLEGTYTGGGPAMGMQEPQADYRMLAAIADGPEGLVFFKLVGPKRTVVEAAPEFQFVVASVEKTD